MITAFLYIVPVLVQKSEGIEKSKIWKKNYALEPHQINIAIVE